MPYIVTINGTEHELALDEIRHRVENGSLTATTKVRGECQDFDYTVGQLLGTAPCKPITFLCVKCRGSVKAQDIDMQLKVNCPTCKTSITVPDKRPSEAKAFTQSTKMSTRTALFRILQGVFLIVVGAGVQVWEAIDKGPKLMPLGTYCVMAILSGVSLVTVGVIARRRNIAEKSRVRATKESRSVAASR